MCSSEEKPPEKKWYGRKRPWTSNGRELDSYVKLPLQLQDQRTSTITHSKGQRTV